MAVTELELLFLKALTINDTGTNGGIFSKTEYVSGAEENVFPNAYSAELVNGSIKWRKVGLKNDSVENLSLVSARGYCFKPTPKAANNYLVFAAATQRDTQADKVIDRYYGAMWVKENVVAGTQTVIVEFKDNEHKNTYTPVEDGDKFILHAKTSRLGSGNLEELEVDTFAPHGSEPWGTIGTTTDIANNYINDITVATILYEPGVEVETSYSGLSVVSASTGDYDDEGFPPMLSNKGTVERLITGNFLDANNINFVDDLGFNYGTFDRSAGDIILYDGAYIIFGLYQDGFTGVFQNGDTIESYIHPSLYGVWAMRRIPVNCNNFSAAGSSLVHGGQSGT